MMSGIRRFFSALCFVFAVCALFSASRVTALEGDDIPVERIELSRYDKRLVEKGKCFISAAVYPSQATNKTLDWSVENDAVATVTSVTAQGAWIQAKGKAGQKTRVIAKATDLSGVTAQCTVEITAPITDIILWSDSENGKILVNESLRIYSSVLPSDASYELEWSISNESVASIIQTYTNGVTVLAHDGGEAVVTARSQDGSGFSKSYVVFVKVPIQAITLPESRNIFMGETLKLKANLFPSNTTETTLRWRSENTNIAYVNNMGTVTAISEGTTRVTVKSAMDPDILGVCQITVSRPVLIINLTTPHPILGVGGKSQVVASIAPYNATSKNIVWSISDESVAKVNTMGLVTGVKPGIAVVSASALDGSDVKGFLPIEVRGVLESISLPAQASLYPGQSKSLRLSVTPYDMTVENMNWISSNTSVAEVSKDGVITGVSLGKATVVATAPNGMTALCSVTVSKATTDIKIYSKDEEIYQTSVYDMYKGDESAFKAIVEPASSESYIAWSSSDKAVARVSDAGVVRAVAPGASRITASAVDHNTGNHIAVKSFTVKVRIPVTSVEMPDHADLLVGAKKRITAKVKPAGASNRQLTWASSDESVAKVDNGLITGCSAGEALILATAKNFVIGVTSVSVAEPVSEIKLSLPDGMSRVWSGDTFYLAKEVYPADANGDVVWKSGNKSVAAVAADGKITAIKNGSAVITATAADGSRTSGSITLNVGDTVSEVSFKETVAELFCDTTDEKFRCTVLNPTIRPRSARKYGVIWSTSDSSVATVNENGKVCAVNEGVCRITARVEDVTGGITVKVMRLPSFITLDIDEMSLAVGDKVSVAADVSFDGSDTYIKWKSSKKRVAEINGDGLIKARGTGVTIITVKTRNGLKASFKLTVSK